MKWLSAFSSHPASVGETYTQHLRSAAGFGLRLVIAGIACLIHSLLPFLFVDTASRAVRTLHGRMVTDRRRDPAPLTGTRSAPE